MTKPTDVPGFFGDLCGGVFEQKVAHTLSDVAAGVIHHGRPGEITLKLSLKQIESSAQITVAHELSYKKPTTNGTRSETDKTSTPMFVNQGGEITAQPKDQMQLMPKASAQDYLRQSEGE